VVSLVPLADAKSFGSESFNPKRHSDSKPSFRSELFIPIRRVKPSRDREGAIVKGHKAVEEMQTMRFVVAALMGVLLAGARVVQAQELPRPAIDYLITLPDGQTTSVAKYKGKVVAVEFLLTTCPHCQKTSKALTKAAQEFGAKGFQPLGVAINPNPEVPKFIQDFGVSYPVGTGPRETVYSFLQHSVMSPNLMMPQLVFIDKNGMVRAQYDGNSDFFKDEDKNIRAMIVKLLAEPATKNTTGPKTSAPAKRAS
jgi:peroxiredoxin